MTDSKKTGKGKGKAKAKAKKLRLNKETLRDLDPRKEAGGNVKGGAGRVEACSERNTGCIHT